MVGVKLDWDRLKVFQTVADGGSINAAAKTLSLSYGKVSKDLEELERALGHTLFDRSNRGLTLTEVGQDILKSARTMADSVQAIADRASERRQDQLVICVREGMATYWLARHLPELLDLQPEAKVLLRVLPETPNLADGEGDIAIQFEKPTMANVMSRQLGWLHYILYASPSYLGKFGEPRTMADLQNHRCLRLSSEEYQPESWRSSAAAWGAILPNTMETNTGTVLMEACASGSGVAALPSYVSEFDDRLTPLVGVKPLVTLRFWLAYTERVRNLEASQPVLHWIRSCFDPGRYDCFREVYVPPQSPPRSVKVANDFAPDIETAKSDKAPASPHLHGWQSDASSLPNAANADFASEREREHVSRPVAAGQVHGPTPRAAVE